MHYAFDLDGTLVDTEAVVYDSYVEAGCTPPNGFFGKPFREWFVGTAEQATEVHARKVKIYAANVHRVERLPLMQLFEALQRAGHQPRILTGASAATIALLGEQFPSILLAGCVPSLTIPGKARTLNETKYGVMFEDNREAATYLRATTGWTVCCTY